MEQRQTGKLSQKQAQVLKMRQADILELPPAEFNKLIVELERTGLFRELYEKHKVIRRKRYRGSGICSGFYELKESMAPDTAAPSVEPLLAGKKELLSLIRALGREKFERYFLFPGSGMTPEETAQACGLDAAAVRRINALVDSVSVMSEFHRPSAGGAAARCSKIARIEARGGELAVCYLAPCMARGRYSIDREKFETLRAAGAFSAAEIKRIKLLFIGLQLINSRKDTLSLILQNITEKQARYFRSGEEKYLRPFTQKELAGETGLAPSSVCRAIAGHSVETPRGEEFPLKHFFPSTLAYKLGILKALLGARGGFSSDEAIRAYLKKESGVSVSRRAVADLRKELGIPPLRAGRRS